MKAIKGILAACMIAAFATTGFSQTNVELTPTHLSTHTDTNGGGKIQDKHTDKYDFLEPGSDQSDSAGFVWQRYFIKGLTFFCF